MEKYQIPVDTGTLDLLVQPVLHVAEERVVFRNSAAALLLPPEPLLAGDLLDEESLAAYRAYNGRSQLALTLRLGGRPYSAAVCREAGYDVFVAEAQPRHERLEPNTLSVLSRSLRHALTELFEATGTLLPAMEELERSDCQLQSARLNQGLYRLLRLAANLSDVGRCMTGEGRLRLACVELSEFLERLCCRTEPLSTGMGLTLVYRRGPAVMVSADPQLLERAVLNLLSNALRFTPRGGRITVSLETSPGCAFVRVTDTGKGIPLSDIGSIFSRYQRPLSLSGDPRQGTGLGLPLVQLVSQLHGGTVMISSGPEGGASVSMSVSRQLQSVEEDCFRSPVRGLDYAGGYDHVLLELSDALPPEVFNSVDLN